MTISMTPFHDVPRDGMIPIKMEWHFHGPTTIVVQAPGEPLPELGGENEQLEAGPGVLAPLTCTDTQALPATHPNNVKKSPSQWTMPERFPAEVARARELAAAEEPEPEPDEDHQRRWWQLRRQPVDAG